MIQETSRRARRVAVLAATLICAGVLAAAPAGASTGWVIQKAPRPGTEAADLPGVSCPSATVCTAVGGSGMKIGGSNETVPLAEQKSGGSAWTIQPTPHPGSQGSELLAVSCVSAADCIAVGSIVEGGPLAESWDGTSWTAVDPAGGVQNSFFLGVSCTSATFCVAVGLVPAAQPQSTETLAETWNGTSWTVLSTPNPAGGTLSSLSAVSCTSASACTAVGSYSPGSGIRPLIERWDGTSWTIQAAVPETSNTFLTGISCPTATRCIAAGWMSIGPPDVAAVAEFWNGTSWTAQSVPDPTGSEGATFSGVSCKSAANCTAVGGTSTATSAASIAEHWDGSSWTIQATPAPHGAADYGLEAVSCPTATACSATGHWNNQVNKGSGHPLVDHE